MTDAAAVPLADVDWPRAVRIIRSLHPPIDLFEDIADPADWPLLLSAEQKTNPRLVAGIGNIDLVPPARRVGGPGASYLMAPFVHVSPDRPSRFSAGGYGLLYAGRTFEVALFETMHHHGRFMAATGERPGWTSQFRELLLDVRGRLHDLRGWPPAAPLLDPDDMAAAQSFGADLRAAGSDGLVYPSVRCPGGDCVGLFFPDLAGAVLPARHLDYHWDGERVDLCREADGGRVFRVV